MLTYVCKHKYIYTKYLLPKLNRSGKASVFNGIYLYEFPFYIILFFTQNANVNLQCLLNK